MYTISSSVVNGRYVSPVIDCFALRQTVLLLLRTLSTDDDLNGRSHTVRRQEACSDSGGIDGGESERFCRSSGRPSARVAPVQNNRKFTVRM